MAFAGRSNAGKSSAINALTGNHKLARTSKTPGRTQLLNFFAIDADHRLVDLPGYGFAKVPLAVKEAWQRHLENYLSKRECLRGLVLLMDIRHPLQPFDKLLLTWAQHSVMPVHILLTKADKLNFSNAKSTLLQVRKQLDDGEGRVSVQLFSAPESTGLDELQAKLDTWLIAATDPRLIAKKSPAHRGVCAGPLALLGENTSNSPMQGLSSAGGAMPPLLRTTVAQASSVFFAAPRLMGLVPVATRADIDHQRHRQRPRGGHLRGHLR